MDILPSDVKRVILLVSPSQLDGASHRTSPGQTITYETLSQITNRRNPQERCFCWLIYTDESEKTAEFLKRQFSANVRFGNLGRIEDVYSALKIFEVIMQIASDSINIGQSVICDCTGGAKTMSIAMALAWTHHVLTAESQTELVLTYIPPRESGGNFSFHKFDDALSHLIAEEQRRYIDQQQRVGRLHYLARLSPILAHEIKNPLNLISADLHLLRDQPVNEYSRELLGEMERSVKEIDKLIVSIQHAVREESEANLQFSIQLAEVVRRIKARTEKRFPELTLEISGPPSKLRMKTAEEKLYVIFTNLIDNAAHASHGKGKVALNFTPNNGHLLVSIEDNGPGIPSDLKPVLFKPMHKGRNRNGTGMGLSIVKMFVTEEGGTITYDDSFTSGTRFLIELPLEQAVQG